MPERAFGLSLAGLPSWASFVSTGNGSGLLRLAPGAADVRGDYAVRVVAQDINPALTSLATQKTFILSLSSFSEAPRLSAPTRVVAVIGQELRVPLSASDLDQDALDWSAIGLPPGARIEPGVQYGQATLVFTPTSEGEHDVSIRLSDSGLPPDGTVLPEDFVPSPNVIVHDLRIVARASNLAPELLGVTASGGVIDSNRPPQPIYSVTAACGLMGAR